MAAILLWAKENALYLVIDCRKVDGGLQVSVSLELGEGRSEC
jgi:hypothetical protein